MEISVYHRFEYVISEEHFFSLESKSSPNVTKKAPQTILVVDDEPAILDIVRQVLEARNYTVVTCRSGNDAWGIIEQGQPKVDLVLTDVDMPGPIDGLSLARKIRNKIVKLPVLFMTGALPENDECTGEVAVKKPILRKPLSPSELVDFVDSQFEESKAGPSRF